METTNEYRYQKAKARVKEIKEFYTHATVYVGIMSLLALLNYFTTSFPWVIFPALGWGIGLVAHGFCAFGYNPILGKNWEERKIRELMDKDEW